MIWRSVSALPPSQPVPGPLASSPLIGRVRELADVVHALAGDSRGVVIDAPAGIGKSRLARAAVAQAEDDGAAIVWVQATRSAASIPLGAFAAVLGPESRADDPLELLRRGAQAVRDQAGGRRLVVAVDDAQLLDPASATLVAYLATTETAVLIVTVRTGEPAPDAVVSLYKDGGLHRLELSALSAGETEQLVESLVGGPVEENARRWIWNISQGNPLYARELTLGALGGTLREVGGLWRMPQPAPLAATLIELITTRLARLTGAERRALELLALGEPLELSRLIALTDEDETLTALEAQIMIRIERTDAGPVAMLAHPLFGEVIRDSLGFMRGRELRLILAADLQTGGKTTEDHSLRIARWLLDAGETVPAALLLTAAHAARVSGDPELAGQLAQSAIDVGVGLEATLVLARSHAVRNQYEQAAAVLAGAEGSIDTPDLAVEYLEQQLAVLYWGLQRVDDLHALLERAESWWPDEAWAVRLAPLRLRAGLLVSLEAADEQLTEIADRLGSDDLDPSARRRLEVVQLAGLFHSGRGREAYELAARLRPALPLQTPTEEGIVALWLAAVSDTGEGWDETERWGREALRAAVRLGDHGGAGSAALILGNLSYHKGRFLEARRWLAEAQLHHELHDPIGVLANTASLQAGVAAALGDVPAAETALALCQQAIRGEQPLPFQRPALACAHAWAALAAGDSQRAQRILLDAAVELTGFPHYVARLTYEAMRAGVPARRLAAPLTAVSQQCDSRLVAVRAAHATCRAGSNGLGLLDAASNFEEMGVLLYASEAAAHAAEAFHDAGRQDSARRASRRSRALFPSDQGADPPLIKGTTDLPELTRRESQLVTLAKAGLSNAEIADQLVLSTRTVESHLYRAMQKLGVGDRRDL
jgi:DNA-binding CsgD family transcriptional regulator